MIDLLVIVATIVICAQLWRMGGNGKDWARHYVLPCVIALAKVYLLHWNWWALIYAPVLIGLTLQFSYGLGSHVHKFWVKIFGKGGDGNYLPVEMATRATCGFLWSLAAIVFACITQAWAHLGIYIVFFTIANTVFGALVKDVEISERGVGASIATSILV
jgi:hypothetical protein